jgi:DnaD/phage-associated family protein
VDCYLRTEKYRVKCKTLKNELGGSGMAKGFLFPGGILSLPREAAERLLAAQNGEAALLYLSLLSRGDAGGLSWSETKVQEIYETLVKLELADSEKSVLPEKEVKLEPDEPPQYGIADITLAMKEASGFSWLISELQRRLGKILSNADLETLLLLYDYLALPPEVILLLVNWCIAQIEKKYGSGRKPTLTQIKKEAFRWHRQGVDTLESAEAYLHTLTVRNEAANRLLPLVGILGRTAVEAERRYLEAWGEMGFEDEAIRMAYEKTVLKKQAMNWPYMNSILRSWHQKGLHTKAEIQAKEQGGWKRPQMSTAATKPMDSSEVQDRLRQDLDRLDRLLEQKE